MKSESPVTPPESNGSKRKRKAISEGKQTLKGDLMCPSFVSCVAFISHACIFQQILRKDLVEQTEHLKA